MDSEIVIYYSIAVIRNPLSIREINLSSRIQKKAGKSCQKTDSQRLTDHD